MLTVQIEDEKYQIPYGTNLLTGMQEIGIGGVNAVCNGQGTCGKCNVFVDDMLMKACEYVLKRDCKVRTLHNNVDKELVEQIAEEQKVLAIDIGTTNICYQYVNGDGEISPEKFISNPQKLYGADVIHRIQAANEGKQLQLHKMLIKVIENIMGKIPAQTVILSANTTMRYFLEDRDPENLGHAPYDAGDISWGEIELIGKKADIIPGISAFVGGDIVSGIYALDMMDKNALLVDLGTNGEMALSYQGKLYVGSAPAGPAFETEQMGYGSTLITACANLLRKGKLDENGNLDMVMEPLQTDIRNLQLGKSAIRAGAETLLEKAQVTWKDVDVIYIAGNFGKKVEIKDLLEIGMLPKNIIENVETRIVTADNTSLKGAIRYGMNPIEREKITDIVTKAQVINLAEETSFAEKFMEYMFFEVDERE